MDKALYHREKCIISCIRLLTAAFLFSFVSLQSCRDKPKEIRILFTGDILLSRNVLVEIEKRKTSPWANMDTLFQSADLIIGNLEGSVGEPNNALSSESGSPVFDIPKSCIPLLYQAGFKAISIENNHSSDLGDSGKRNTINELLKAQLTPIHYGNSPQFFKINELTIAIVALNLVPGRDNKFQTIPSIEIRQKLRFARSLANMVVVSIHWGSELLEWPNRFQRDAAKWLISNGADLIIGSHPHVIQKPEMINGKPVFFSLGNHLFDQKYPDTKEGLIVECIIRDGTIECNGIITHTSKNSFFPEIIRNENYKLTPTQIGSTFTIADYSIDPISVNDSNQSRTILQVSQNGKKIWQTHPMAIAAITKSKLDSKNEYLITLENHYSSIDHEINLRPYVYTVEKNDLVARWRGSALAWPLLDADISPDNPQILCALHRGDSFINLNPQTNKTRVSAYKWNGFGFSGVEDAKACGSCENVFLENKNSKSN